MRSVVSAAMMDVAAWLRPGESEFVILFSTVTSVLTCFHWLVWVLAQE